MRIDPRVGLPLVVVLLVIAVVLFLTGQGRHTVTATPAPARCPACGHEFVPEPGDATPVCPSCGQRADVRLLYYECDDCGAVFVAYEFKPAEGLIREPGGEWMGRLECTFQPVCPECTSRNVYAVANPASARKKPTGGD